MVQRTKASRLRQRLRDLESKLSSLLASLVAERQPLVRGAFQSHGTRCGKPNCKCLQGELHPTAVLVVSEQGQRRNIYVRAADRQDLERRNERYRRLRQNRAEIARVGAELLGLVDELLEALIEPYPPPQRGRPKKRLRTRRKREQ